LRFCAASEAGSRHPLAEAITVEARRREIAIPAASRFEAVAGCGVVAHVEGRTVYVGRAAWLEDAGVSTTLLAESAGSLAALARTPVLVGVDGRLAGLIGIADPLREGAREAVARLRSLKCELVLLTGDRREVALATAREVGIERVVSEILPGDKAAEVRRLRAGGRRIAMVGDGVNDAPALAAADLGVALGSGSDVAIAASDLTLVGSDPRSVAVALELSRRALRTIRQNLGWAFAYNVLGIPLATGVLYPWTGWRLSPVVASAAMALSSVSVVMNSLRLRRFRPSL
jgi:Cu+-exporting ATPase